MIYRRVQERDYDAIASLLLENNIEYDIGKKTSIGFIVEDNNKIVGFIFAHPAMLVEPFICSNPVSAIRLGSMMEGAISALGIKVSLAHASDNLGNELIKSGYERINRYSVYKKVSK